MKKKTAAGQSIVTQQQQQAAAAVIQNPSTNHMMQLDLHVCVLNKNWQTNMERTDFNCSLIHSQTVLSSPLPLTSSYLKCRGV